MIFLTSGFNLSLSVILYVISSSSSSSSSSSIPQSRGSLGHPRWFRNRFPPVFPVLHCPLGLKSLTPCLCVADVVFPPLPLSVFSSPFHYALQNGFGQTWWTGDMTIPLQFASLYDGQVFVWSDCLLDLGTDCLVGNMVFVWDVQYQSHGNEVLLRDTSRDTWFTPAKWKWSSKKKPKTKTPKAKILNIVT